MGFGAKYKSSREERRDRERVLAPNNNKKDSLFIGAGHILYEAKGYLVQSGEITLINAPKHTNMKANKALNSAIKLGLEFVL